MNMEDPSDRLKYLWEKFVDTPWDDTQCRHSPVEQIIIFNADILEEMLYFSGFTLEEISMVIMMDGDLRQFPGGPISPLSRPF